MRNVVTALGRLTDGSGLFGGNVFNRLNWSRATTSHSLFSIAVRTSPAFWRKDSFSCSFIALVSSPMAG